MSDATVADSRTLVSRSGVVAAGTLLSRVSGLLRLAVTLAVLGDGLLGDTYSAANNTPNIVYELLLGGILTATLVPIFVDAYESDDERAVRAVLTFSLVGLFVLSAVAFACAPWIADIFAHRNSYDVAVALVRCFMPQMFFYGFTALAGAALNARRRFVAAAFAPVVNNVVAIVMLEAVAAHYGTLDTLDPLRHDTTLLLIIGLGTTLGIVVMAAVMVPPMHRSLTSWAPVFDWRHPAVVRMLRLSGWTFGYVIANQIALAMVLHIASTRSGEIVAYTNAFIFFQLPHGLFAVTIMTALTPELASGWRNADMGRLRRDFARGMRFLLLVIVPSAAGLFVVALPVVGLLKHGSFGPAGVARTGAALAGFAVGLVPFSVYLYTLRAFYAMGDTRTPFIINCFENGLNIVLALALHDRYGVRGLALSYSLAYVVAAIGALVLLHRRLGGLEASGVPGTAVRATAAAAVAGLAAYAIAGRDGAHTGLAALGASVLVAGAVYVGLLVLTGARDVRDLLAMARHRGARGDV